MDSANINETTVVISSAQIGKTECLGNILGYFMHQDPSPILRVDATLEMAETYSKDRLLPMLRDSPALTQLIDIKSKNSSNTILKKNFKGGQLTMAGSNSPASLASRPIRVVLCDEIDRYPHSAGTEGDPVNLAIKRSTTFWNRRIILVSTPTIKGASRIEKAWNDSDKRRYYVPCPHCGEYQVLRWESVKWDKGNEPNAWYECGHCRERITTGQKVAMLRRGEWRASAPFKGVAGFHLNEFYSPWRSFGDVVVDFLKAKDDPQLLKVWVNTSLGETFDEQGGEGLEWQQLLARCEPYPPGTVPDAALILTAGVDVQNDRLSVSVWGWGLGEESWLIYTIELYGDPSESKVWGHLDTLLTSSFTHESGIELKITAAAIDTGFLTQEVYNYVRTRKELTLYAIKGLSTPGKAIVGRPSLQEVSYKGKLLKKGVRLWPIGTDTAKELIYARLRIKSEGPGYLHFPLGTDEEFFLQLCAEKVRTVFIKGFPKREWVKIRPRNEALDTLIYAYAAAIAIGIGRIDWNKLRESLIDQPVRKKAEESLKTSVNKVSKPVREKTNFANSW